tara:strand:- start:170 stop:502 length:333 start_codon:yes stop_codon:yes gene_type:complete
MYDFQMPSKLVKRGDPLPPMPPGLENLNGASRPNASMQPQQPSGMEALMANYSQPAMRPNMPSASLYGGIAPQQMQSFGMPQMFAKNAQNAPQMGMGNPSSAPGPSFFTL